MVVDVVTAVEAEVNGRLVQLNLDLDDNRALVKAAATLTAEHPDPESAEYRGAHAAARDAVLAMAAADLTKAIPDGKPSKRDNADVKLMREAQTALNDPQWIAASPRRVLTTDDTTRHDAAAPPEAQWT